MSTTRLEEEIVGVNETSNQAIIQQFSGTLPGIDINFQRLGIVLQEKTIVCWLNVAGDGNSEKGKILCVLTVNIYSFIHFIL